MNTSSFESFDGFHPLEPLFPLCESAPLDPFAYHEQAHPPREHIPTVKNEPEETSSELAPLTDMAGPLRIALTHKTRGGKGVWLPICMMQLIRVTKGIGKRLKMTVQSLEPITDPNNIQIKLYELLDDTSCVERDFNVESGEITTSPDVLVPPYLGAATLELKVFHLCKHLQFHVSIDSGVAAASSLTGKSVQFSTHDSGKQRKRSASINIDLDTVSAVPTLPIPSTPAHVQATSTTPVTPATPTTVMINSKKQASSAVSDTAAVSRSGTPSPPPRSPVGAATPPALGLSSVPKVLVIRAPQQQRSKQQHQQQLTTTFAYTYEHSSSSSPVSSPTNSYDGTHSGSGTAPVSGGDYLSSSSSVEDAMDVMDGNDYAFTNPIDDIYFTSGAADTGVVTAEEPKDTSAEHSYSQQQEEGSGLHSPTMDELSLSSSADQQHLSMGIEMDAEMVMGSNGNDNNNNAITAVNSVGDDDGREGACASSNKKRKVDQVLSIPVESGFQHFVSGSLDVQGVVRAQGFVQYSDIRLKTNVEDIMDALQIVSQLQGKRYQWKDGCNMEEELTGGRKVIGLIAQEVKRVLPEVVVSDRNGYLAVNYADLVPLVIEALKQHVSTYENDKLHIKEEINQLREKIQHITAGLAIQLSTTTPTGAHTVSSSSPSLSSLQVHTTSSSSQSLSSPSKNPSGEVVDKKNVEDPHVNVYAPIFTPPPQPANITGPALFAPGFARGALKPEDVPRNIDSAVVVVLSGWSQWSTPATSGPNNNNQLSSSTIARTAVEELKTLFPELAAPGAISSYPMIMSASIQLTVDDLCSQIFDSKNKSKQFSLRAQLESAPLVWFVGESHGVIPLTIVCERLFQMGVLASSRQLINFLSIGGIHHHCSEQLAVSHPNPFVQSGLHDFYQSAHYHDYKESLAYLMEHGGVSMCAVGAHQDSLVDVASATCDWAHHPSILRAVYVNQSLKESFIPSHVIQKPDNFTEELLMFALEMKNTGRELDVSPFASTAASNSCTTTTTTTKTTTTALTTTTTTTTSTTTTTDSASGSTSTSTSFAQNYRQVSQIRLHQILFGLDSGPSTCASFYYALGATFSMFTAWGYPFYRQAREMREGLDRHCEMFANADLFRLSLEWLFRAPEQKALGGMRRVRFYDESLATASRLRWIGFSAAAAAEAASNNGNGAVEPIDATMAHFIMQLRKIEVQTPERTSRLRATFRYWVPSTPRERKLQKNIRTYLGWKISAALFGILPSQRIGKYIDGFAERVAAEREREEQARRAIQMLEISSSGASAVPAASNINNAPSSFSGAAALTPLTT